MITQKVIHALQDGRWLVNNDWMRKIMMIAKKMHDQVDGELPTDFVMPAEEEWVLQNIVGLSCDHHPRPT